MTDEISWSLDIRYCGVQLYFVIKIVYFVRLLCYLSPLILSFSFSRTIFCSTLNRSPCLYLLFSFTPNPSFFVLPFILKISIVSIHSTGGSVRLSVCL